MSKKILIVVTSHSRLGNTDKATGIWAEEFATPYYALADAGLEIVIASPAGGNVPFDPNSLKAGGKNSASVERLLKDDRLRQRLDQTFSVADVQDSRFDAVFLPGGHGTMWDLPQDAALARLLARTHDEGRLIAAVCHGPAGLVNVKDKSGRSIIDGKRVNAFTNDEEEKAGLTTTVPFLLETRLRELGARFENGPSFQPYSVRDGNLITGQNPMSSELVAQQVLEALNLGGRASVTERANTIGA